MLTHLRRLLGHTYKPLNRIEISQSALKNNYLYLNSLNKDIRIAPVLKSNAYGHGITLIAKELDTYHPSFFCIDSLYEAYELLKIGIRTPVLVMGYFSPKSLQTKRLPFSFAVFTKEQLVSINKYQPQAKVHVFIDSGMHREGVLIDELEDYLAFIKTKTNLVIEGLMSHLAMSDKPEDLNTQKQIDIFKKAQDIAKKINIFPKWIHLANSSGILNSDVYGNSLGNVFRVGLALYGIDPAGKNKNLMPLLKSITHIVELKEIKKGDYVGYDFTFMASKKMKIAVLPLGYYDGVDRRLSNLGCVQVNNRFAKIPELSSGDEGKARFQASPETNGKAIESLPEKTLGFQPREAYNIYCPIVGRVSMNITVVDVSNVPDVYLGQEVVVYSRNKADKNSIENEAKLAKTIPYDLLVHLAPSTKRVLI